MAFDENWERSLGRRGGTRINTTTPTTGNFTAIKALSNTTIASAQCNIANINGAQLLAGDVLPGIFTSITLTSGDVIAYNA